MNASANAPARAFASRRCWYVLACVAALTAAARPCAAALTKTNTVVFAPWSNGRLSSSYSAVKSMHGYCWSHSLASERSDSWRCMSHNDIFDPCFSSSLHAHTVACATAPFSRKVGLMSLTKPLPLDPDDVDRIAGLHGLRLRGEPWGLRLTDGETCQFISGATEVIAGMRLNYGCDTVPLLGTPDRSSALWTIYQVPPSRRMHPKRIGIVVAVF